MSAANAFPLKHQCDVAPVQMDFRTTLAWKLVGHFGMIVSDRNPYDNTARLAALLGPEQVVSRSFSIADLFIAEAEKGNGLRVVTDADVVDGFICAGYLEAVRENARWASQGNGKPSGDEAK